MKSSRPPVLYLSYDGLTDPLGQSQILPYVVGLSREYSMTIVSVEKPDRFLQGENDIRRICMDYDIQWNPIMYHKNPPVISTLFDLRKLKYVSERLHKVHHFRIVHCRSYITSLIGLSMKRRYGTKFIFDMRGFWADERVEGGLWNLKNPLYKSIYNFFKRKEKKFLQNADHIISLTENARDEIMGWKFKTAPITIIPTCVDMTLFNPDVITEKEKTEERMRLGILPDDFVLVYIGSWGTWYRNNDVINLFSVLKKHRPLSKLLMVTPDISKVGENSKDIIVVRSPRKGIPLLLSISNVSVCFILPSYSKKASSATKMAEAWAMNISVVTNSGWGDIDTLYKNGYPILLCDEEKDYETAVRRMIDHSPVNVRSKMDFFTLSNGIKRIEEIYKSCLAG